MIIEELRPKFDKERLIKESSLSRREEEIIFIKFLKKNPIKTAVEIGTYNGISTVLLSRFAEKVITIDIEDRPLKQQIWNHLKIKNIKSYIVRDNKEKKELLNNLKFDFAFIDGDHNDVGPDLEACRKCKRILFHDYNNSFQSVDNTVNSLPKDEVEIEEMFAYWEEKN